MAKAYRFTLCWLIMPMLMACSGQKQPEVAPAPGPLALELVYQEGRTAYTAGEELERLGKRPDAIGKFEEAATKFARVVESDPRNLHALINWGAALSRSGKLTEAIPKFQQALLQDPSKAEAYYNWGVTLERLGKHQDAVEKYEQAVALKADLLTPAVQRYLERHRPPPEQDTRIKSALPLTAPSTRSTPGIRR